MIQEEKKLWKKGYKHIVGIDEAGRGPLAGPVVASALCLLKPVKIKDVKDSKKLSPKKREEVFKEIVKNKDIKWGIGIVNHKIIDKINILEATKLAMIKAVKDLEKKLKRKTNFLLIDGKIKLKIDRPQKGIIKGDDKIFSISAASIIAKVARDKMMEKYDKKYRAYNFKKHKGYGTKEHILAIKKNGLSKIHRKSFRVKGEQRNKD